MWFAIIVCATLLAICFHRWIEYKEHLVLFNNEDQEGGDDR